MLDQWSNAISAAIKAEDSQTLAKCFPIDTKNTDVAVLQNFLWQTNVESTIAQFRPDWEWSALTQFAKQYLWLCYYINPQDLASSQPALRRAFAALQVAFTQNQGYLLNDTVIQFVSRLGYDLWVASPLLRIFNNIRSEREPLSQKQEILLFVATRLCRVYFSTDQTSLCDTIFKALKSQKLSKWPIAQQVELQYAQGRYALIRGEIEAAFKHLQWSYNHCIAGPNKARVFQKLMLPALLTGRMLSPKALQAINKKNTEQFNALNLLCLSIKQVNFSLYLQALETPWVRQNRVASLIQSSVPVLILRRAIKRLHRIKGKPRALHISEVRAALQASHYLSDDDSEYLRSEQVCIALIDARMMFANMIHGDSAGDLRLTMRPTDPLPALLMA